MTTCWTAQLTVSGVAFRPAARRTTYRRSCGLGRAIPCSIAAEQRHKIIGNRLALVAEESVSGVTADRRRVNQEHPFMRIYIIGNDGITLCRKAPATVNDGEIAVASNEELHAASLSGKRLLALWNALPGVPKRRKVGDREALIDQLWSAIEMLPDPEPQPDPKRPSKQDVVIAMLRSARGCNGRRGGERDRLAASHRSRRPLGNLEEEARAHPCLGHRGARPGLPHRRAGQPMKPPVHDASARQHSGEPSSGLGANGGREDRLRNPDPAGLDGEIAELVDRSTQELRRAWRTLHHAGPPLGLSRDLIIRGLADKLEQRAHGGPRRALQGRLRVLAGGVA